MDTKEQFLGDLGCTSLFVIPPFVDWAVLVVELNEISFQWQLCMLFQHFSCQEPTSYLNFLPHDLFSCGQKYLPFCLREVWVVTACLTLVKATAQRFTWRTVGPDMEKDFYRLQADLYFYARTKVSSPLSFQNFHHSKHEVWQWWPSFDCQLAKVSGALNTRAWRPMTMEI